MQQVAQRVLSDVPGARLACDSAGREPTSPSTTANLPTPRPRRWRRGGPHHAVRGHDGHGQQHPASTAGTATTTSWTARVDRANPVGPCELTPSCERWVCGRLTNDQLMFEHSSQSVGVANIRRFEAQSMHKPRYITLGERGEDLPRWRARCRRRRGSGRYCALARTQFLHQCLFLARKGLLANLVAGRAHAHRDHVVTCQCRFVAVQLHRLLEGIVQAFHPLRAGGARRADAKRRVLHQVEAQLFSAWASGNFARRCPQVFSTRILPVSPGREAGGTVAATMLWAAHDRLRQGR